MKKITIDKGKFHLQDEIEEVVGGKSERSEMAEWLCLQRNMLEKKCMCW